MKRMRWISWAALLLMLAMGSHGEAQMNSLQAAINALSNGGVLEIATNYSLSANVVVPSNIILKRKNGIITLNNYNLQINGLYESDPSQGFNCNGTGLVRFAPGSCKEAYSTWFGTKGDGSTDDKAAAIAAAYAVQGTGIKLIFPYTASGYVLSGTVNMNQVRLCGQLIGTAKTTFLPTSSCSQLFSIGSVNSAEVQDNTEMANFNIDFGSAPSNAVGIYVPNCVKHKTFRNIMGYDSANAGGNRASIIAKNASLFQFRSTLGPPCQNGYNNFEQIRYYNINTCIDAYDTNVLPGGSKANSLFFSSNTFVNTTGNGSFASFKYIGVSNTFLGSDLGVSPNWLAGNDFLIKQVGTGNTWDGGILDMGAGTGPVIYTTLQNRFNLQKCDFDRNNVTILNSNGNPVSDLGAGQVEMTGESGTRGSQQIFQKRNLLFNPFFKWPWNTTSINTDASFVVPGWTSVFNGATCTLSYDSTDKLYSPTNCLQITVTTAGSDLAGVQQTINYMAPYAGKNMTLAVIAKGAAGGEQLKLIYSGSPGNTFSLTAQWAFYQIASTPGSPCTVSLGLTSTGSAYIDSVFLVPGWYTARDILPQNDQNDLAQCFYLPYLGVQQLSLKPKIYTTSGGSAVTPDASLYGYINVQVNDTTGFTINAPINLVNHQIFVLRVYNNSGGTMGTITWDSIYSLSGAFTNPASGKCRYFLFHYDTSKCREMFRSAGDV